MKACESDTQSRLCLWGTPQGFTQDDVALLREAAKEWSMQHATAHPCSCFLCTRNREWGPAFRALASRIGALLPPEDTA